MSEVTLQTNGDLVAPVVAGIKKHVQALAAWARANPDEVCVGLAPVVAAVAATRRHRLSFTEALIVSELGYWCGVAAVAEYRRWKARPAGVLTKVS